MSLLTILVIALLLYIVVKCGEVVLNWVIPIALFVVLYWVFTSGGGSIDIKFPSFTHP